MVGSSWNLVIIWIQSYPKIRSKKITLAIPMNIQNNINDYPNIDYASHKSIQVNNADYVYLEAGEGDLIVLLHGYPDNAYSW